MNRTLCNGSVRPVVGYTPFHFEPDKWKSEKWLPILKLQFSFNDGHCDYWPKYLVTLLFPDSQNTLLHYCFPIHEIPCYTTVFRFTKYLVSLLFPDSQNTLLHYCFPIHKIPCYTTVSRFTKFLFTLLFPDSLLIERRSNTNLVCEKHLIYLRA